MSETEWIRTQAVWHDQTIGIDIIRCDRKTAERDPPPSVVLTNRIADELPDWPVEICRIVSNYLSYYLHTWNLPTDGWRDLIRSGSTVSVEMSSDNNATDLPWYRCVSNWTLLTGSRRWTINYPQTAAVGCDGWIACGVVLDDQPTISIRQGDWYSGVGIGPSYWLTRDKCMNIIWINDGQNQERNTIGEIPKDDNRTMSFEADDQTFRLTAVVGSVRYVLADFGSSADLFYRMRPAVLIAGQMAATLM